MLFINSLIGMNSEIRGLHIGESTKLNDIELQYVQSIEADGDELEQIINWGYPDHKKSYQYYYGDTARQILANW